eukprot:14516839-Alexandrium_andersonii.AAC.1
MLPHRAMQDDLRARALAARAHAPTTFKHIKSRCGHPRNDMADWMADAAVKGDTALHNKDIAMPNMSQFELECSLGLYSNEQYPQMVKEGMLLPPIESCPSWRKASERTHP